MNYKVLYRKYRPDSFKNIVGQEYTIKMLQNAVINDRISHAYLFTGPRGTGKTSSAKVFAKTVNCENPVDGEACGKCQSCLNFHNSPDIIEIDAASNNGVDNIRELIDNVKVAPSMSKYKIYIIDEVHMLSTSAFNALLLTLEEPPKHAIFILATTNVEQVPITIISRCQRFSFQKISMENLEKQIKYVCDEENIKITDDAVTEISYLSEGGLRDALSLLDQLSAIGDEITIDSILSNYGSISTKFIKDLMEMVGTKDTEGIINSLDSLENSNTDYKVFIKKVIKELSRIAVNIKIGAYQGKLSYKQVKKIVFDFNELMNKININVNPYVLIKLILLDNYDDNKEVTLIKEPVKVVKEEKIVKEEPKKIIKEEPIVDKKEEIKEEVKTKKVLSSTKSSSIEELKRVRVNNCFVKASKESKRKLTNTWDKLAMNDSISKDILSLILDSKVELASDEYIVLSCAIEAQSSLINSKLDDITYALKDILNNEYKFIALTNDEWKSFANDFIKKKKNNEIYEYIDEKTIKKEDNTDTNTEEEVDLETNIFERDKIEIV